MTRTDPAKAALLDGFDEPTLVVEGRVVKLANEPAKALFGRGIEGSDVRLAIRHPRALQFVLAGRRGDLEFTGVGAVGRPWRLSVRPIGSGALLVRLVDRSAAHAAEKLRVDFVANASHELRTPLTAVLGYAESLQDGDLDRETAARFAGTIQSEAQRMLRIIEDLMSLSRIEADRFVLPSDSIDVAPLLESAIDRVRSAAQACGCALHLDVEDALPPIAGDFPQVAQLVDNLLSNAVRYGCAAGDCRIRLSGRRDGADVLVEVRDSGPGIPRQHLPFLTRRFYRVDPGRSRDSGGTGLGLAIVKHIVERHRGTLAIDSEPGQGTTVSVRLPARD